MKGNRTISIALLAAVCGFTGAVGTKGTAEDGSEISRRTWSRPYVVDGVKYTTILSAISAAGSGHIVVPPGTYNTGSLEISSNNVVLECSGSDTVINFTGSPDEGLIISGSSVEVKNCKFQGQTARAISITGNRVYFHNNWVQDGGSIVPVTGTLRACIQVEGTSGVTLRENVVTSCGGSANPAVAFDIVSNFSTGWVSTGLRIIHNKIYGSNSAFAIGLFNVLNSEIKNNSVNQNNKIGSDPTASGYGVMIYQQRETATNLSNNTVSGNHIRNTAGSAIYVQGSDQTVIDNNRMFNCSQKETHGYLPVGCLAVNAGYPVHSSSIGVTVTANRADTTPESCYDLQNAENVTVTGNTCRNATWDGIHLARTTLAVISSNIIDTVGRYGIEVEADSTGTRLGSNSIHSAASGLHLIGDFTADVTPTIAPASSFNVTAKESGSPAQAGTQEEESITASTSTGGIQPPPQAAGYTLKFQDDFTSLCLGTNTTNQTTWYNPGMWWESAFPVGDASISNSILTLSVPRHPRHRWMSTSIATAKNVVGGGSYAHKWRYGYFEVRMAWNPVAGAWPSIWMMPVQEIQQSTCTNGVLYGELDIFEGQNTQPTYTGAIHQWRNCVDIWHNSDSTWQVPSGTDFAQYHKYGALWIPGTVTWYFDDQPILTATTPSSFDTQDFYLVLSNMSGGWAGNTAKSGDLSMKVDWVRVWQP